MDKFVQPYLSNNNDHSKTLIVFCNFDKKGPRKKKLLNIFVVYDAKLTLVIIDSNKYFMDTILGGVSWGILKTFRFTEEIKEQDFILLN